MPKGPLNVILVKMNREKLYSAALVFVLASCLPGMAQGVGYWRAANQPAQSTTGDVAFSETRMAINFSNYTIAQIRPLEPGEVSSVFDVDSNLGGRGTLYRTNIPGSKTFLHKKTLCGGEEAQWVAAYVEGRSLHIAFFSGDKMPVFTPEAVANSTELCGTFLYAR